MMRRSTAVLVVACSFALAVPARAQITIGAILSITGSQAAQGAGYKNAFDLLPAEIAGQKVTYLVRDDGGDPTAAANIARKLIAEDHVDAFIGPASTAPVSAVLPIATEAHVPMVAMSPYVIDPKTYPFAFDDAQPIKLMVEGVVKDMQARGAKTTGFIGFGDGWGDLVLGALKQDVEGTGIDVVDEERYARTDTSVQPQVLKAMSHHPDVMMLGGSAVPVRCRKSLCRGGATRARYTTITAWSGPDYIRVGGAAVDGCIAPTGPLVVYDQLPDGNVVKPVATAFMQRYLDKFGPQSRNAFAGYTYDAGLLIAGAIPAALKAGKPGSMEFRDALRNAIEQTHELVGTHGVYSMSATDHNGMDERARVMVQVQDGAWKLLH